MTTVPARVQGVQQRLDLGDLVGLVPDLALGQHRAAAAHRGQQVHRPPVGLHRAAYRLAVHRDPVRGDLISLGHGRGRQPRGQLLIQRARIGTGQRPADRGLARCHQRAPARVTPHAHGGQHRRGRLGGPLADRDQRPGTRGHRRAGQAQDRHQRMPPALRPPVIRHGRQELRQPRQRAGRLAGWNLTEARGQDMNRSSGTIGSRHGRLARHRGLPGQAGTRQPPGLPRPRAHSRHDTPRSPGRDHLSQTRRRDCRS